MNVCIECSQLNVHTTLLSTYLGYRSPVCFPFGYRFTRQRRLHCLANLDCLVLLSMVADFFTGQRYTHFSNFRVASSYLALDRSCRHTVTAFLLNRLEFILSCWYFVALERTTLRTVLSVVLTRRIYHSQREKSWRGCTEEKFVLKSGHAKAVLGILLVSLQIVKWSTKTGAQVKVSVPRESMLSASMMATRESGEDVTEGSVWCRLPTHCPFQWSRWQLSFSPCYRCGQTQTHTWESMQRTTSSTLTRQPLWVASTRTLLTRRLTLAYAFRQACTGEVANRCTIFVLHQLES